MLGVSFQTSFCVKFPTLRQKEEPFRLLRGIIFFSTEQTPLWHFFVSSFLSGAVFSKIKRLNHSIIALSGDLAPDWSQNSFMGVLNQLWVNGFLSTAKLAPLFFLWKSNSHGILFHTSKCNINPFERSFLVTFLNNAKTVHEHWEYNDHITLYVTCQWGGASSNFNLGCNVRGPPFEPC